MKRALVIVLNRFTHDTRVLRQVHTLTKRSQETFLFALHEGALSVEEVRDGYVVRRFQLVTRAWPKKKVVQCLKYLECLVRMTIAGMRFRPELVHANDLDALPIGFLVAKLTRARLIYDSHELWSEPNAGQFPRWLFKVARPIEAFLCRRTDSVITVSESISHYLAVHMRIAAPTVIRNLPDRALPELDEVAAPLRETLALRRDIPIVLYLGMVGQGRGLETLVDAMQWVEGETVAVLMGPPQNVAYLDQLKARALHLDVAHRVHFLPPVPPGDINRYAKSATIGVCPIEDFCLSYRYSLGNKIFQYLQAGLPLLVSDLPEMSALVKSYDLGEVFPERDSRLLAKAVNHMQKCSTTMNKYRANVTAAATELDWPHEEQKLLALYDRLYPPIAELVTSGLTKSVESSGEVRSHVGNGN